MSAPPSHVHEIMAQTASASLCSALDPLNGLITSWMPSGLRNLGQKTRWRQPPSFSTLPFEILFEILKELDWFDVLRVRQVSRSLCSLSKDKFVWTAISRKHENDTFPHNHFLEKKLSALSATELEEAFLRPRRVDNAWTKSNTHSFRTLSIQKGDTLNVLLPGGRWAIATNKSGQVVCYDLHSPLEYPPRYPLVDAPPSSARKSPLIRVDEFSSRGPYLTFNFAVFVVTNLSSSRRNRSTEDPDAGHVLIYRVESEFNDDGRIVKLSSAVISRFNPAGHVYYLELCGQYVLYDVRGWGNRCMVEWKLADNRGRSFERRWLPLNIMADYPLPNGLAMSACYSGQIGTSLYDLKVLPLSTAERGPVDTEANKEKCKIWSMIKQTTFNYFRRVGPCKVPEGLLYLFHVRGGPSQAIILPEGSVSTPAILRQCCIDPRSVLRPPEARRYSCLKFVELKQIGGAYSNIYTISRGRFFVPSPSPADGLRDVPFSDILIPESLSELFYKCQFHFEGLSGRILLQQDKKPSCLIINVLD